MALYCAKRLGCFDDYDLGPEAIEIAALEHGSFRAFHIDLQKMNFTMDVFRTNARQRPAGHGDSDPYEPSYPVRHVIDRGREASAYDFMQIDRAVERGCSHV
jgi:hypothetical protein